MEQELSEVKTKTNRTTTSSQSTSLASLCIAQCPVWDTPGTVPMLCVQTQSSAATATGQQQQQAASAQQQMADLLEEQGEKVRVNEDTVYPTLVRILEQQYISTIILRTKEGKTITLDVEASDTIETELCFH